MPANAAMVTAGLRMSVLWFGRNPPPNQLVGVCMTHGMQVTRAALAEIDRLAPLARAALFELPSPDPTFDSWGVEAIGACHNHGVTTALVLVPGGDHGLPVMQEDETDLFYAAVKALPRDSGRTPALFSDWNRIGLWLRDGNPGPGANMAVQLQGDLPGDANVELLIRRAFHDFPMLRLVRLTPGKSGASVWYVEPLGEARDRRALPFIIKIDARDRMLAERSNASIVRGVVSTQFHAALDSTRCVEGESKALVVYENVAEGRPLYDALPTDASRLVLALFEHTLGAVRRAAAKNKVALSLEFSSGRVKVLNWSPALEATAEHARVSDPTLPKPAELKERLARLPRALVRTGTVHGDLHVGNLFAAGSEVVMIDYGSVTQQAPIVADPACFEVSLSFPRAAGPNTLVLDPDEAWLRRTYAYPPSHRSVPVLDGGDVWLSNALREIRLRTIDGDESGAYAFALASNLLRYASYEDNGTLSRRALAYELACRLIDGLEQEMATDGD